MQIHTIPVSLTFMEGPSYIQCVILDGGEYSSADGQELQGVSRGLIHWILCNIKGLSVLDSHPMMRPA